MNLLEFGRLKPTLRQIFISSCTISQRGNEKRLLMKKVEIHDTSPILGAVAIGGLVVGTLMTLIFIPVEFVWLVDEETVVGEEV